MLAVVSTAIDFHAALQCIHATCYTIIKCRDRVSLMKLNIASAMKMLETKARLP
jgi:hypothetical protein